MKPKRRFHPHLALPVFSLLFAGCVADTKPDEKHLKDVDALFNDREGGESALKSKALLDAVPDLKAQSPQGELALKTALELALSRNLALVASAENLALAQIQLAQAGLLPNPTLGQSGGFLFPIHPADGIVTAFDAMLSVTINGFLTAPSKSKVAELQRMQTGIDIATQAFQLAGQVKSKYRDAVLLRRQQWLAQDTAASFTRAAEAAQARLDAGIVVKADVLRAKAQAADAMRQAQQAEREARRAMRDLNWLMGYNDAPRWSLPEKMEVGAPGISDERLETLAVAWRLDLRRALLDKEVSAAGVKLAKWGYLPQLGVGVDVGRDNSKNRYWGPNISIGLPIFDQGIVGVEQAKAVQRQMDKTYTALEGQVHQDVRGALTDLENARANAKTYREVLVPQQEEATRLVEESWKVGVVDFETWLSSLRDLMASRAAAAAAQQDEQHALVALEQSVGLSLEQAQKLSEKKP